MRLRPNTCYAKVTTSPGRAYRPITMGLGPGINYELTTDEARQLALDLADAIDTISAAIAISTPSVRRIRRRRKPNPTNERTAP